MSGITSRALSILCVLASVALAGCPGAGTGQASQVPGSGKGAQAGSADQPGPAGDASARPTPDATPDATPKHGHPAVPSRGVPCDPPVCMYHGGSDSYHLCLVRGQGECFHHGASCTPQHLCMYDARTATYRACTTPGDGRCASFGAACEPPGTCVYNPADRRHHRCVERAGDGRCTRMAEPCDPE